MIGERPKTAEELNAELYEKVSAEFEEYKNNLLMMSPEQMLEHAYAYAIRSDIVPCYRITRIIKILTDIRFELGGLALVDECCCVVLRNIALCETYKRR